MDSSILKTRVCFLILLIIVGTHSYADDQFDEGNFFQKKVLPIFQSKCQVCHGAKVQESGYRLDVRASAMSGGEMGIAPIITGNSQLSPLIHYVSPKSTDVVMPPRESRLPNLTAEEIQVLSDWIDRGAVWPDSADVQIDQPLAWWSLQPLEPMVLTKNGSKVIDDFVHAKLDEHGLAMSPPADARTLARRLYFDLIGLPPMPDDLSAFEQAFAMDADRAVDELAERLLASQHYGERWARHWLDVVHYGDTHGFDKDKPRPNAWPYRDYIIRSLNEDKPYSLFIQEQIAGDVLGANHRDGMEALGFLAAGPWDFIGHAEVPESKIDGKIARHLDRDDMVSNVMGTFCSVTIHCAQCHQHKFDPITQEDYYSLHSVFSALDRTDVKYYSDPEVQREYLKLRKLQITLSQEPKQFANELQKIENQIKQFPNPNVVYAAGIHLGSGSFVGTGVKEGKPRPIFVLARGQVTSPGAEVSPGALSALPFQPARFELHSDADESMRRVALAEWIIDPKNPLTWRSIVNRIWQYHFGRGIVDTPNDFGRNGALPSHPELLDWLANDFRDNGGSIKRLHRMIVRSSTYRQSSSGQGKGHSIDSGNALLWRQNRKRLEAEAIRDSVLFISGKLDPTMGGPGWQDFVIENPEHSPHYEYALADPEDVKTFRRSVYRFIVRSQTHPWMTSLDCADPSMRVDKRNESVSALQALSLLNNGFMLSQSKHFADRVARQATGIPSQIDLAYQLALGCKPSQSDRQLLIDFAEQHGMSSLCRVLWNLNAFSFVD